MSTDSGKVFFEQFIDDYFAECDEHLSSARGLMLQLEKGESPAKPEESVVDGLLRNFHSIKGLSAMVGMEDVTQLAHHIEDYLRLLKDPRAEVTPDGIAEVLVGINTIEQVLNARRKSEAPPDISQVLVLLTTAADEARPRRRGRPGAQQPSGASSGAAVIERKWKVEFSPSAELAAKGITLTAVREKLGSIGQVVSASPRVLDDGGVAFDFTLSTTAAQPTIDSLFAEGVIFHEIADSPVPPKEPAATPFSVATSTNIVRVDMSRLDDLMRVAGDLVVSRFHLDETLRAADHCLTPAGLRALQDINSVMERQVRELRETVIRTRMVPIGQIFERMRFVARGLERETEKKVHVEISGQDTEVDKIIVERMMDPMLHLVRNAISHGIEMPNDRIASGKPPEGTIRLSAMTAGDSVTVEVEDDGGGLDTDKVAARARSLGMLDATETLDAKRLLDVICAPGFTTRDAADLASGRGVGMAAVQAAISELGGLITLHTTPGKGTRFNIQLPLTLAIADSLLVTVAEQRFAIPQANIREVLAIESSDLTAFENNEVIPYRGAVIPILRLTKMFGLKAKPRKRLHVLVIGNEPNAVGLAVDRITGQREIVVRAVTDPMLRVPGISGATELGDGRPVLILDVHSLMRAQRGRAAAEHRS
jgi:two-component system chemotaxis sensor kinase CheA